MAYKTSKTHGCCLAETPLAATVTSWRVSLADLGVDLLAGDLAYRPSPGRRT